MEAGGRTALAAAALVLAGLAVPALGHGETGETHAEGTELALWPMDAEDDDQPVDGLTRDESGNGYHLEKRGSPSRRSSPDATFDGGYDLNGTGDHLYLNQFLPEEDRVDEDLSLLLAFEVDDAGKTTNLVDGSDDSTGQQALKSLYLQVNDDGALRYHHDAENASRTTGYPDVNVDSKDPGQPGRTVSQGLHTLTLRRDLDRRVLHVDVDDRTFLDVNWSEGRDPAFTDVTVVIWGALQGEDRFLDGAIHEARLWTRELTDGGLDCIAETGNAGHDCPQPPAAPENLTATARPGRIVLDWGWPPGGGAEGFAVYRSSTSCQDGFTHLANVSAPDSRLADADVEQDVTYCYLVRASNLDGLGNASDPAEAGPLPEPDPAVADVDVEKTRLRTDYLPPVVNPAARQEVTVTVANPGDNATEPDGHPHDGGASSLGVTVEACPQDGVRGPPTKGPLGACDRVDHRHLDALDVGETRTFETWWSPVGEAGDHEVVASVDYARPQAETGNDVGAAETFVAAGGTGFGGVNGPP